MTRVMGIGFLWIGMGGVAIGLDFGGWTLEGPGKVISSSPEAVGLSYESPDFKPIVVRPAQPVALPENALRLRLWYARLSGDFDLYFLLRDAAGQERAAAAFTSRASFPAVRRFKTKEWSVWNQAESVNLVPPESVEEHVEPEFMEIARRSEWRLPLSLIGIEIRPARDRRDNEAHGDRDAILAGKGTLYLTELGPGTTDGLKAGFNWSLLDRFRWGWDTPPRLFADDLTLRSGELRFALELRKGYQGPVVWRKEGNVNLDRADPMRIFSDKIELPELPKGRYFLDTKTWLPDGSLDATRSWQLFVAAGKPRELSPVESPMAWETGRPDHVFLSDAAEAVLHLRIKPEAWPKEEAKCAVRVVDWLSRPVLNAVHARAETISIRCPVRAGADYRAIAELRLGEKVLDRSELHFGAANTARDFTKLKVPAGIPTRDELLMSRKAVPIAEHWGSLLSSRHPEEPITEEQTKDFDKWLEQVASLGIDVISFNFGWGEAEPMPGVFRWEEIERRLDLARQRGMKVFLTPTEWGHPLEWPLWIEYEPMLDQFGYIDVRDKNMKLQPSPDDPIRQRESKEWIRAVAGRFLDNPAVIGYRTKPFIFSDANKPEFTRTDYSPPAQAAFDRWLADAGKKPIPIPKLFTFTPYSPARTGPDLSEAWRDFMAFRTQTYVESVRSILASFRAVDSFRQIHIYRSSMPSACEAAIPLLKDGAEFHDEGGPFYFHRAMESLCLQDGIPYTNEGHQFTPPSIALVDSGFFYGSIYDRGWCWLYRWNIQRPEDPRFAALPQVLRFIADSLPHVREWAAAGGAAPEVLLFGSRADRLLSGGRQGFHSQIGGIEAFTALFCYHQVPAHFANEFSDWVDLSRFKVVFAVGDVLPQHSIERLAAYAEKGGKLVLVGDVGKFCPERRKERDLLRQRVGSLPNVKAIPAPDKEPPAPGAVSYGDKAFDGKQLDAVLAWAGIQRIVRTESRAFDCVCKPGEGKKQVYVAVFRRWPGPYDNVWYDGKVKERWGLEGTTVVVSGLPDGRWRVEKFHRDSKLIGEAASEGGALRFNADPALVGELQLFRLTAE